MWWKVERTDPQCASMGPQRREGALGVARSTFGCGHFRVKRASVRRIPLRVYPNNLTQMGGPISCEVDVRRPGPASRELGPPPNHKRDIRIGPKAYGRMAVLHPTADLWRTCYSVGCNAVRAFPAMSKLDPIVFVQLPMIRQIVLDEIWLEAERRGCLVTADDGAVRENVCLVVLRIGAHLRESAERMIANAPQMIP